MDYVIDANVLISMLISGKASYYTLTRYFHFYMPAYALFELEEYQGIIFEKSRLQPKAIRAFTRKLFSEIRILPTFALDQENLEKADILVADIDVKDKEYLALAIQLDMLLLSRDKSLVNGLKKKGFRKIMMFDEFLKSI